MSETSIIFAYIRFGFCWICWLLDQALHWRLFFASCVPAMTSASSALDSTLCHHRVDVEFPFVCAYCAFTLPYSTTTTFYTTDNGRAEYTTVHRQKGRRCACRQVHYCDSLCQLRHWHSHRLTCMWKFFYSETELPEAAILLISRFLWQRLELFSMLS